MRDIAMIWPIRAAAMATAALLCTAPAFADEIWSFVTRNETGVKVYVDTASLQRSGDSITFWQKWDLSETALHADNSVLAKYRATIDCAGRRQILLTAIKYDAAGKVISSFDWSSEKPDWRPIKDGSVGAQIADAICTRKSDT